MKARQIHRTGYNCSSSVRQAFSDVNRTGGNPPAPRNIAEKCGVLLTAQKVLRDLGINREDELEHAFKDEFGYVTCRELMSHGRACNDYVAQQA